MSEQTGIDPVMCPWCGASPGIPMAYLGRPWGYITTQCVMPNYDHRICARCQKNEGGFLAVQPLWVQPEVNNGFGIQTLNMPASSILWDTQAMFQNWVRGAYVWPPRPRNAWEHILADDDYESV